MRTFERSLSGLAVIVAVMFSGCTDPTAPGGTAAPTPGSYDLRAYDGKAMPALYEQASYGTTTVLNGTLTIKLSVADIVVNYIARDTTGATLDAYSGGISAIWKATAAGGLSFGDGLGGLYALTGQFHGDSVFIAVPDVLTDGTAHTGLYTFVRQP
jgi:hypothetical protein